MDVRPTLITILRRGDTSQGETLKQNKTLFWKPNPRGANIAVGKHTVVSEATGAGQATYRTLTAAPTTFVEHPTWVFIPWIDIRDFAGTFGYPVDQEAENLYGESGYPMFIAGNVDDIVRNLIGVGFIPVGMERAAREWVARSSIKAGDLTKPPRGVKIPVIASNVRDPLRRYIEAAFREEVPLGVREMEKMTTQELNDVLWAIQNITSAKIVDVNGVVAGQYGGPLTKSIENTFTNRVAELVATGQKTDEGTIDISNYAIQGRYTIAYASGKRSNYLESAAKQEVPYALKYRDTTFSAGFVKTNDIKALDMVLKEMEAVRKNGTFFGFVQDNNLVSDAAVHDAVEARLKRVPTKKTQKTKERDNVI